MLILAIIWLAITIFAFIRAILPRGKGQKITLYMGVKLGWDLFLGADLLFWGLSLKGIINLDEWLFILLGLIYFIGLVFIEKLKNYGKHGMPKMNEGSDFDEFKE